MENNTTSNEGPLAKAIEEQTAKLPSDIFLWAALGAMGVSLTLKNNAKKTYGIIRRAMGSAVLTARDLQQAG